MNPAKLDRLRELLEEIMENYDEGLIAHDNAEEALALLQDIEDEEDEE